MANFYSRPLNCIYLQSVRLATFIYISFPKQYHALNTVFRLFHSYAEISNIFCKINYNDQYFQALRKSSLMVKASKYSIKSEAAIHMCTIKSWSEEF